MKLRLIEQACGFFTVQSGGRRNVRARLCLLWRVLAMRTMHRCRWFAFATEAAMKLRLIEQACGFFTVQSEGRRKVRARLCLWRVLAVRTMHLHRCRWFAFATEAAMKLRLIEQACGCSTVCDADGLRVRARLCLWRVRAMRTMHHLPLQRKPPWRFN